MILVQQTYMLRKTTYIHAYKNCDDFAKPNPNTTNSLLLQCSIYIIIGKIII